MLAAYLSPRIWPFYGASRSNEATCTVHLWSCQLCAEARTHHQHSLSCDLWMCMAMAISPLPQAPGRHSTVPGAREKLPPSLIWEALCDVRHLRCLRLMVERFRPYVIYTPFLRFTLMERMGEKERKAWNNYKRCGKVFYWLTEIFWVCSWAFLFS